MVHRLPRPAFLLLLLPLGAQEAMRTAHETRALPEAPATLILLDAPGTTRLRDAFASLLRAAELRGFEVPQRALPLDSGPARALVARYGLAPKPQWVLAGRTRTVLAKGEAAPSASELQRALEGAGLRDPARELGAYLKRHPDQLDARDRLLALLRRRGERVAEGAPEGQPLPPARDLEAWGAFAQEFDAAFRSGQWRELDLPWLREARPLDAASPTLQVLYRRWMPEVEAALRRHPESEPCWALWLWMEGAAESGRLPALLADLVPGPLTTRDQWPPDPVALALLGRARSAQDWRALRELFLARWTEVPRTLRERAGAGARPHPPLLEQDWSTALAPLLECCLRAGDPGPADTLFVEAVAASQWPELPARGAALARRCGQPQLAARWAALPVAR